MENSSPAIPNKDTENLNLLAIFHYILGGLVFFSACIPIIHLVIGIMLVIFPEKLAQTQNPPPEWFGLLFIAIAIFMILTGWISAICIIISGRMIANRRHWTFSFVMAIILCLFVPLGTILGVFTIIVMNKGSVKAMYPQST